MRTIISITAVATLAAGLALASPPDERPRLQPAQGAGELILPLRIAGIGPDFKLTSPWYEYSTGGVAGVCGELPAFDIFEGDRRVQPSPPTDGEICGGYDPNCASPCPGGYRWFFGSGFQAPMIVNDLVVEPGMEGLTSDLVQFAWHWAPPVAEQCFVAVFISEDFDNTCTGPPATNNLGGVVLDFGVLAPGNGYYWTAAELCNSGLFLEHPADGAGAYTIILASDYDPGSGTFTPPTSAQTMLWGMKDDPAGGTVNPGEHPEAVMFIDSEAPFLEIDPVRECFDLGPGSIPCPTGNIGSMFIMYLSGSRGCIGLVCGDTNCDGRFDGADIDTFFLALADPAQWETRFPLCDLRCAADINGDTRVNGGDIDPFFRALGRNGPCNSGGG